MVDQAKMTDHNGGGEFPPRTAARNVAELLHDVMLLAELQSQLAAAELQQELKKAIAPSVAMVCGVVLGLSCLPIALVCVALALVEAAGWSHALAFLVTVVGGVTLAAILVLGSLWYLRSTIRLLERSRAEWNLNLRWVRGVLKRLGSTGRARFGAETAYRW